MCGIVGFAGRGNNEILNRMVERLRHRGPDDSGIFVDKNTGIYFGHRRLSIVDITDGQQPMAIGDGDIVITYNGEIYNAGKLRKDLEIRGHRFKTDHSDTEVLLHGYKEWGEGLTEKLNGMWAFAIYDKSNGELFLSRDRFGQKPLFFTLQNKTFVFASELKAFEVNNNVRMHLSDLSLQKYCAHGYFPGEHTPFSSIYKLGAGHNLKFDLQRQTYSVRRYWSYVIEPQYGQSKKIEDEWCEKLVELLDKSVQRRLISDVPVGVFLSGGLDSAIISAFARKHRPPNSLKTFSIGFEDSSFDETPLANKVADFLGTDHTVTVFQESMFADLLQELLDKLDEPLSDSSLISQYLLSKKTKEQVTVTLGGDAADEIFCGYDTFKAIKYSKFVTPLLPRLLHPAITHCLSIVPRSHSYMSFRFKLQRLLEGIGHKPALWQPLWLGPITNTDEISDLFGHSPLTEDIFSEAIAEWDACESVDVFDRALQFYGNIFLQNQILTKVDRTSMMHGLEVRTPFLDIDLIDCVRTIPSNYKIKNGITKYILKKSATRLLPPDVIWRSKVGFSAPLGKWLSNLQLGVDIDNIWTGNASRLIHKKLDNHRLGIEDNRLFLWNIVLLTKFLERRRQIP